MEMLLKIQKLVPTPNLPNQNLSGEVFNILPPGLETTASKYCKTDVK
jgi:hypothetical protein